MLSAAANNAKPTKYAQNKRHGIYEGTPSMMNLAPERCSAPKTANGMAKHKLLKATILSRPPARAISIFEAHTATRRSTMAAPLIETTVRETSRNVARIIETMWMPSISSRSQKSSQLNYFFASSSPFCFAQSLSGGTAFMGGPPSVPQAQGPFHLCLGHAETRSVLQAGTYV